MDTNPVTNVCAIAGSTIVLMARLKKSDGSYVIQGDVTSIRVDCFQELYTTTPTQPYASSQQLERVPVDITGTQITSGAAYDTPLAANVVFNSLQTDSRWTPDSTGYNFAYKISAPKYEIQQDVRITLSLANGDTLILAFLIDGQ